MSYNEIIESKTRLMTDFARFFNLDFNFGVSIKLVDVVIHQPKYSYIDCLVKSESYNYNIEFIINIHKDSGEDEKQSIFVEFPKMSDKGFLIANADGLLKWRSCINIGEVRMRMRIYQNTLITNFFNVTLAFHRNKNGSITSPKIKIGENSYPLISILLSNGYTREKIVEVLEPDDPSLVDWVISKYSLEDLSDFVFPKVDENFRDKYFLMFHEECDETINAHNLATIVHLARVDQSAFDNFSPFDVNFISNYDAVITELNACSYELILKLTNYFSRYGRYNGNILSKSIRKIFSLSKNKYAAIQTASDSNPAGFLGQSKKIYFYKANGSKVQIKYNEDFVGLICPLKTPESVSQVDVKNELARDVVIVNGHPEVYLLDKSLSKITLPYRQYYRSKILTPEYFDYENKQITPKNGKIVYLYAGKYYTEEYKDTDQFDYIRYTKSGILSYNASLIPMANKNDSVRLAMGTNMIDQAIPTIGSSPAICATGAEKEIFEESDWSYKSPYSGKVVDIINNFIKVQDDNGEIHVITTPPDMSGTQGTFNKFTPTVKIGDSIKAGEVIVSSNSFKHNQLCLSSQLVIAFDNYGFYDEEDGVILSSDAVEILGHDMSREMIIQVPTKLRCILDKDKFIETIGKEHSEKLGRLNKFGLPKPGQTFRKGEPVAVFLEEADPDKYYRAKIKKQVSGTSELITRYCTLPYGLDEGTVESVDVLIPKGITEDGLPEVRKYYDNEFLDYEKNISNRLQEIIYIKRAQPDPAFRVTIKIKFKYVNLASIGSKVSNVYASKGSIVKVIDKDLMPRIGGPDGRQIQIIINPKSTFNRKNIAQLITAKLGYLSVIAHDRHTEYIKNKEFDKIRIDLNKLYVTNRFDSYDDQQLIKFHDEFGWYYQLIVGPTDDKYTKEVVTDLSNHFGVPLDSGEKLFIPEFNTMTEYPVEVGIASIMRLHFFPESKMKATGSFYTGDDLKFGIGHYRPGGQSIGEMEGWALSAHGTNKLIDELTGTNTSEIIKSRLEAEMLMVGLAIDPMRMIQ